MAGYRQSVDGNCYASDSLSPQTGSSPGAAATGAVKTTAEWLR
jgi:hypothetical protein